MGCFLTIIIIIIIEFIHDTQDEQDEGSAVTDIAKKVKLMAKKKVQGQLAYRWEQKPLHGKYVAGSK